MTVKGPGAVLVVLDLFLHTVAFVFPQRTCFGSNNRRWKGFFSVDFRACWFFLLVVVSLFFFFFLSLQSFYLACTSNQGTENKSGCGLGSSSFSQVLRIIKKKNMF